MNAVAILIETNDDVWTEVARGCSKDELLEQIRAYIWKDDDSPVDEEESTGPPKATYAFHVEGKSQEWPNGDFELINPETLEEVAEAAIEELEQFLGEREEEKEEELPREAPNNPHPHPLPEGEGDTNPPISLMGRLSATTVHSDPEEDDSADEEFGRYGALRQCA